MENSKERLLLDLVLSYRRRDLGAYLGKDLPVDSQGQEISPLTLSQVDSMRELAQKVIVHKNTYFQACDIYIRQKVEPLQHVLNNLMHGAKAQVGGQDIEFSKVIPWCQDQGKKELRDRLEKEVRALCRFLSPFSQATWEATFSAVKQDLGYDSYLSFIMEKKGQDLRSLIEFASVFLSDSSYIYFHLVDRWFSALPEPVDPRGRSRYDAIYLLGLRYLDAFFPQSFKGHRGVRRLLDFLRLFLKDRKGLHLHVKSGASGHSYCLPIRIPQEIHVITGNIRGWIDLEGLFHELGHAFFLLNNRPDMDIALKDFYTDFSIGEAFAFVFQLMSMDTSFLTEFMGLPKEAAEALEALQAIKFLTLARRYGTKGIIEFDNLSSLEIEQCQRHYAEVMKQQTGFRYQPETYLFDLMPDLYSLDYFQAFLGSWSLRKHLKGEFGPRWYKSQEASVLLRSWAVEGNIYSLSDFLNLYLGRDLSFQDIVESSMGLSPSIFSYVKKMAQKV